MNYSQYLIRYPYKIFWRIRKFFDNKRRIDFFCGGYVDYVCFKNIHKYLPEVRIVAKNKKVSKELESYGIKSILYPTFPDVIIMARHLSRKFPEKKIRKIGMRHGAYHFKDFVTKKKYNAFDRFMLTSSEEVRLAKKKGIVSGVAVGFPKIDSMFNGEISDKDLMKLRTKLKIDPQKRTVIFAATWDRKDYSVIDKWIHRIEELAEKYNVLVTVHQWTTKWKQQKLEDYRKINFIRDKDILKYLMISDIMIADISSIIAEFNALNKPIITFRVPEMRRFTSEIRSMLDEISFRIDTFDELKDALKEAVNNPEKHQEQRLFYNKIMFDKLDGRASERALAVIKEFWS